MATIESEKRSERRRNQKWWERLNRDPEIQALRRAIAARQRYQQQHPYSGRPGLLLMHISHAREGCSSVAFTKKCQGGAHSPLVWLYFPVARSMGFPIDLTRH